MTEVEKAEQIAAAFLLELKDELSGHRPTAALPNPGCIPHQVSLAGVCFHFSAASRQKDGGQRMANAHKPFISCVDLAPVQPGKAHMKCLAWICVSALGGAISIHSLWWQECFSVHLHHQRAMLLTR